MIRYILLGLLASTLTMLAIIATIPSTDSFSPDNPGYNGISVFVTRYNASITSIGDLDNMGLGTAVLVIGPDKPFEESDALTARRYVERGGILVIADDFGSGNTLLSMLNLGVRFNGSLLLDPVYMYRNPALPIATVSIANNTYRLYLNYATFLSFSGGGACIGFSSIFSYADSNLDSQKDPSEPGGPLCIVYVERLGSGSIYVVSDPSVFINAMLGLGDNSGFIDALLGDKAVYVVGGLWSVGSYTVIRSQVIGFLSLLLLSSIKYPVIAVLSLIIYAASKRIYMQMVKSSGVPRLRVIVDSLSKRHPEWDKSVLERLAREVGGLGEERDTE